MTDTPNKRGSAIHVGLPWRGILPFPDGEVSQEDRFVVGAHYAGIIVEQFVLSAETGTFVFEGQPASLEVSYRLNAEGGTFTLAGQDATLTYTENAPVQPRQESIGGTIAAGRGRRRFAGGQIIRVEDDDTRRERREREEEKQRRISAERERSERRLAELAAEQEAGRQRFIAARRAKLRHFLSHPRGGRLDVRGQDALLRRSLLGQSEGCTLTLVGADVSFKVRSALENKIIAQDGELFELRKFKAAMEARQARMKRDNEALTLLLVA